MIVIFLSIFCLFAYSMPISVLYTHTRTFTFKNSRRSLNRRSTIQDQIVSLSNMYIFFFSLFVIKSQQLSSSSSSFSYYDQIIYHEKSVCSFSHLREKENEREREYREERCHFLACTFFLEQC
jgi:hypothetical protein